MRGGMAKSVLLDHAAELLGVSRRTIYYRIRDGRLRTVRTVGGSQRVLVDSIELLLREQLEARDPGVDVSDRALSARSPMT
jgi:excisionase family DNA binding protein